MGFSFEKLETDGGDVERLHIDELRKKCRRIDHNWLVLHYKISLSLVLFACIIECLLGVVMIHSELLTTSVHRYIWKYIVIPTIFNFFCIAIDIWVMRSKRFSQTQKIYTVSLLFVAICFVLFSVHSALTATFSIFSIAIILTTIYASYRVTCITALTSIGALVLSELFIRWDTDKASIFESTSRFGSFVISLSMLIAFSAVCMVKIYYERRKIETSIQLEMERCQLQKKLDLDTLTGTLNRKALHDTLRDMEESPSDIPYILAVADIDNFKGINDRLGHAVGDQILIAYANVLQQHRGKASVFRYGGDEFCLLFEHADMEEAVSSCKQIQENLSAVLLEDGLPLKLTASFGLAAYSQELNAARLFVQADQALYKAKESRNAISISSGGGCGEGRLG